MTRHQRVVLLFGLLLVGAVLIGGCASRAASDERRASDSLAGAPAETELVRARASVSEAEQAGAAEYGSAQLALARDKLRAAEEAAAEGEIERARRLAVEADLDADLATAITRNRETQALAAEVRGGLQTLEAELRRATSAPAPE